MAGARKSRSATSHRGGDVMQLNRQHGWTVWTQRALMLLTCTLSSLALANNVPSATPWGADYFPNTLLTDQDGRQLRFFDDLIKDKVVVINCIFTSCTDSCPLS